MQRSGVIPIDDSTPKCFYIYKASNNKAPCVESRESAVRVGKHYFTIVKRDVSPKFDSKSANARFEKVKTVKRKTVRRQITFKLDDWYEKAALSFTIRRQAS